MTQSKISKQPKLSIPIGKNFDVKLLNYVDCLEARDGYAGEYPADLFHSNLNILEPFSKLSLKYLNSVAKHEFKVVSFHCGFKTGSRSEMLKTAYESIGYLKYMFDGKIAIENNNYFPAPQYDIVTDADFISQIVYDNDIHFLFDKAHAEITIHNRGLSEYKLPMERCIQVHLSKPGYQRGEYIKEDLHDLPDYEEFDAEYVTIEYYKDNFKLMEFLKKWRTLSQKSA